MDWKQVAGEVANFAPLLGGLLGGPAGAAAGSLVASALGTNNDPASVQLALKTNPDAAVKLRQIEADQATRLAELTVTAESNRLAAQTASLASVNATMQIEAKSDHWATWFWRPAIGLSVAFNVGMSSATIAASYIAVMFFQTDPQLLTYLPAMLAASAGVIAVTMPVLGIASYFRGKSQADPGIPTDNRG